MVRTMMLAAATLAPMVASGSMADAVTPAEVAALPSAPPRLTAHYGPAPQQIGKLYLPAGRGPFPVVELIHGGCWTRGFATLDGTAPLASALAARGVAVWNIEYRQVGDPGGAWPGTFRDWAAATDYLRVLARRNRLDLTRVTVAGHSAGAHAALWVAARSRLPRASAVWSARPLKVRAAVAIDGPGALIPFIGRDAQVCGKPVIVPLMGGVTPALDPQRYKDASPLALQPHGVKEYLVEAAVLDPASAADYKNHGEGLGDTIELLPLDGSDHFQPIAPDTGPGRQVVDLVVRVAQER